MNSTTESDNKITNDIKIDVKKKEVSSNKKSLKILHRKRNFRYKPY